MSFLQCASSSQAARAAFETSSLGISGNSLTRAYVRKGHERVPEFHGAVGDGLHVVCDVLRVGGDNRAVVVVVRAFELLPLIEQRRIEDEVDPLLDQPLDVAVGQLCGIALGLGRDRLDAHLIDLVRRRRGENHAVAKLCEEGRPEGVVLIHVQDAGDADGAPCRLFGRERAVAEDPAHLVLVHVRDAVVCLLEAEASLAAVSGDELSSV